mmetsp:Transcript_87901/g.246906  ORF Transcript_87901/g.246906 Transcript_87901/m.246906 type:complete len:639 (-) Transcript_87901:110-2026(-)
MQFPPGGRQVLAVPSIGFPKSQNPVYAGAFAGSTQPQPNSTSLRSARESKAPSMGCPTASSPPPPERGISVSSINKAQTQQPFNQQKSFATLAQEATGPAPTSSWSSSTTIATVATLGPAQEARNDAGAKDGKQTMFDDAISELREDGMIVKNQIVEVAERCTKCAERTEALERGLAEVVEAQNDSERGLGKELRDLIKTEIEGAREMMMREMRERMDGQKVLREEAHLQQQALASFTSRVDEVMIELRTELPRLGQECVAIRSEMEQIASMHASHTEQMRALEMRSAASNQDLKTLVARFDAELREHVAQELKAPTNGLMEIRAHMDDLRVRFNEEHTALGEEMHRRSSADAERSAAHVSELRKLHNESFARAEETQSARSKDLRDHVAQETERASQRVEQLRVLLDDCSSRMEGAFKASREHLALERDQRSAQAADLQRSLAEHVQQSEELRRSLVVELREHIASEAERLWKELAGVQSALENVDAVANTGKSMAGASQESADRLQQDIGDVRGSLNRLEELLQGAQGRNAQRATEVERKLAETETELKANFNAKAADLQATIHTWVDETIVARINSLDRGLRTEMAERSAAVQQVSAKFAHNADRWCQLQAKFDEVLMETQKARRSGVLVAIQEP